jgi:hypothetical protein
MFKRALGLGKVLPVVIAAQVRSAMPLNIGDAPASRLSHL